MRKKEKKRKLNKDYAKIITILSLVLFLLPLNIEAQENNLKVSNASLAEKIYLQLDRKVYANGDTVWFKCIISNASEHIPSVLSGILHVELIGDDKTILQKKLIKIKNGIGQGNFDLDKKIPKGTYLIRAYTQWNQNFDNDFLFEEYIQVFTKESQNTEPINSIKLIKDEATSDHLEVLFNPEVIDSLQKNKLTVFLTIDGKKDSLLIKKDKNDKYILDYKIKKESQFATLKIHTENTKTYSKTFVLNKDYIDLQFFPESGELVHGQSSKVGFKALDANGKGKFIDGDIVDEKEAIITSFKSNMLGMGSFFLINADSTKKYYARARSSTLKNKSLTYPLPNVAATGNTLSIHKLGNNIAVRAFSNYMKNDSIILRISFRGTDLYEKKVKLNQGLYQSLLSTNEIPEGIISFTLLDNSKNPIAERLYFNKKTQGRIKINLSTNKNKYTKRELTNLNIQTTNHKDEPIKANTSILVINKEELGTLQSLRQNILSYFLIDSELKGNIENPGYYFKNDSINNDLEALMLTQGWSKYNYSKPYTSHSIKPEKSLTVSGKVNKLFSEKKGQKDIELTLITSGKNKSIYTQKTDSLGKFNFDLNDEYGKEIEILIQTAKKLDIKTSNSVVVDEKKSPSISFEQNQSVQQIDSIVERFVEKRIKQKEIDQKFETQFGGILLNEVNVTNTMSPNRKKVTDRYGKPNTIISGKEIRAKEEKWSYGLYSILLFYFIDKVTMERDSINGHLQAIVNNMPTLVVIDGIPVQHVDYEHISYIRPSEVTSFEIIENAKDFGRLYCEVHNELSGCIPPSWGNVIAIYTRAGIGLTGTKKPKGITQTSVPVFSLPQEFYAPKYENINPDDWQYTDTRTLIHWQPILKTDDLGKAATSFYNTDNKGNVMVIVEAISNEGEIGYQELCYEIND